MQKSDRAFSFGTAIKSPVLNTRTPGLGRQCYLMFLLYLIPCGGVFLCLVHRVSSTEVCLPMGTRLELFTYCGAGSVPTAGPRAVLHPRGQWFPLGTLSESSSLDTWGCFQSLSGFPWWRQWLNHVVSFPKRPAGSILLVFLSWPGTSPSQ